MPQCVLAWTITSRNGINDREGHECVGARASRQVVCGVFGPCLSLSVRSACTNIRALKASDSNRLFSTLVW